MLKKARQSRTPAAPAAPAAPACPIRPLSDRVVLRRDEAVTQSQGGILLPDSAAEKPSRGTVVAVGPGKAPPPGTDPLLCAGLGVRPGDRVLYSKYAGVDVPEHEGLVILRVDDVLAVIEE